MPLQREITDHRIEFKDLYEHKLIIMKKTVCQGRYRTIYAEIINALRKIYLFLICLCRSLICVF